MIGPILKKIKDIGHNGYIADFRARKVTKAEVADELEFMAQELQASDRQRRDAEKVVKNLEDQLHGVKHDCRRAEEVADEYIRRLEAEKGAHLLTSQKAARALHGMASIFGKASPVIADDPREDRRGGDVNMTIHTGGPISSEARAMLGARGEEALMPGLADRIRARKRS